MGSEKGSQYERDICVELSLWWTKGEREDIFWRVPGSGGRARRRGKKGLSTFGQHDDVKATDPIGLPLTKLAVIEVKRGYNRYTIQDMLDKPEGAVEQMYESWIRKSQESSRQAGTEFWMIIVKRDRRVPIILMPTAFAVLAQLPSTEVVYTAEGGQNTTVMRLEEFFQYMKPEDIKTYVERGQNSNAKTQSN